MRGGIVREVGEIANPLMVRGSILMFALNIVPMFFNDVPFFAESNMSSFGNMLRIWLGFILGISCLMGAIRTEKRSKRE